MHEVLGLVPSLKGKQPSMHVCVGSRTVQRRGGMSGEWTSVLDNMSLVVLQLGTVTKGCEAAVLGDFMT